MYGWTRLPSELWAEDQEDLEDLMELRGRAGMIERLVDEEKRKGES